MFTNNIYLFIFSIQNSTSFAKTKTLNGSVSELILKKEKQSKICIRPYFSHHFVCLFVFLIKILDITCYPEYFGVYFAFKNGSY